MAMPPSPRGPDAVPPAARASTRLAMDNVVRMAPPWDALGFSPRTRPRARPLTREHRRMSVHFETDGPVAVVTIDRPDVANAVDRPTADALVAAFRSFEDEDALAVAVETGANGTFSAGADLKAMRAGDAERVPRVAPDGDGPVAPTRMLLRKP